MNNLFMVLILISLFALIIGMVKPNLVLKFIDEGKRSRKKVLQVFGLMFIASFIMFAVTLPDTEDKNTAIINDEKENPDKDMNNVEEKFELSGADKTLLARTYGSMTEEERQTVLDIDKDYDSYSEKDQTFIADDMTRLIEEKKVIDEENRKIEEKETAERKAQEEKEAAERKAKEEKEAAEREVKEKKEKEAKNKEEKIAKERAEKKANESLAQSNAVKAAENYLSFTAFSKSGLIKQLEFEGYSNADASYAVGQISVDWNEQAFKSGENYLSFTSFSRSGLIDQLKFEGYSNEQATYAVDKIGL